MGSEMCIRDRLNITKPIAVIKKYIGSVTPSIPIPDLLILRDYLILNKYTMSLIVLISVLIMIKYQTFLIRSGLLNCREIQNKKYRIEKLLL